MAPWFVDAAAIEAEIDRIRSLGLAQLRARWRSIFGALPPVIISLTKDLIGRMIAYRVQEEAFGGLDRTTIKLLHQLGRGEKPGADFNRRLKAGTYSCPRIPGREVHRHGHAGWLLLAR